jgi:hypothetical protein
MLCQILWSGFDKISCDLPNFWAKILPDDIHRTNQFHANWCHSPVFLGAWYVVHVLLPVLVMLAVSSVRQSDVLWGDCKEFLSSVKRLVMRPENSVLCPLAFFSPDHFSFSGRISSRQPQQSRWTQQFSGLLQLNTSRFRPPFQHNNSFIRPIKFNVMIRSYVLGLE